MSEASSGVVSLWSVHQHHEQDCKEHSWVTKRIVVTHIEGRFYVIGEVESCEFSAERSQCDPDCIRAIPVRSRVPGVCAW